MKNTFHADLYVVVHAHGPSAPFSPYEIVSAIADVIWLYGAEVKVFRYTLGTPGGGEITSKVITEEVLRDLPPKYERPRTFLARRVWKEGAVPKIADALDQNRKDAP